MTMKKYSWCRWHPGLEPVAYTFTFTLIVVEREPARRIVSTEKYCSETEILTSIALLGRDGYDFIYRCRSWTSLDLGVSPEELRRFDHWQIMSPTRTATVRRTPEGVLH